MQGRERVPEEPLDDEIENAEDAEEIAEPTEQEDARPRSRRHRLRERAPGETAPADEPRPGLRGRRARSQENEGRAPHGVHGRDRHSKGKGKGRKKADLTPVVIVGVLILIGAGFLMYPRTLRKTFLAAVAGGNELGFDGAVALAGYGTGSVEELCSIADTGGEGSMAAAAALALIMRKYGAGEVVPAIREHLKGSIPVAARKAYAAALSQSWNKDGEAAAAEMLSDADGDVRLTAIRGLAVSKTAEATQAVGRALGDASAPTRKFAEDVVSDWGRTSPDRARLAIEAALATGSPQAETAAARVTAATATIQDPANVLPLLSSQLPEVRVYALKTLQYCLLGSPMRQNPQLLEKIGALIEAPNEPHEVKAAALDLVGYCSLEAGGGWALKILRTSSDFDLRAKAALAIAAAKPEGAYTAVMDAVTERDLRRVVRIACLIALERLPSPPREQVLPYATRLLDLVDDEDQTISGLALLAMRKVTGKPDAVYDKARWHAWYERRRWEEKLAARVLALLDKAKAEYEKSDPKDPEKAAKEPVLNNATQVLQDHVGPKSKAVDDNDRAALQAVVNRVVEWHTELKKAWATQR